MQTKIVEAIEAVLKMGPAPEAGEVADIECRERAFCAGTIKRSRKLAAIPRRQ